MEHRSRVLGLLAIGALVLAGCRGESPDRAEAAEIRQVATDEWKIANAMTAGPAAITADATVIDWPEEAGADMRELRAGANNWVCMPDNPATEGNDPMCVDEPWLAFMEAFVNGATPRLDRLGVSYMTAEGGVYASTSDPAATGPTPDNGWGFDGPHIMIVVPDPSILDGMPVTRESGGPYVMYSGTEYAHIMVPVE
jgi:hypothetical protein